LKASIQNVVATTAPVAPVQPQARAQQGSNNVRSGNFFTSPAGIITLAVFGAGLGYAIYSSQHDRITSPGR
jgi:hypothetical protein